MLSHALCIDEVDVETPAAAAEPTTTNVDARSALTSDANTSDTQLSYRRPPDYIQLLKHNCELERRIAERDHEIKLLRDQYAETSSKDRDLSRELESVRWRARQAENKLSGSPVGPLREEVVQLKRIVKQLQKEVEKAQAAHAACEAALEDREVSSPLYAMSLPTPMSLPVPA